MQIATSPGLTHERPSRLELLAGGLLAATVVLHVVAMFPTYFTSQGSLASQTDQAALYAVLAASWALALAIGISGPDRTKGAAALAVGVAATELGFRLSDVGDAVKYGTQTAGAGLWLMSAAWGVGALAAAVCVAAVLQRHRPAGTEASGESNWDSQVAGGAASTDTGREQDVAGQASSFEAGDNPYYDLGGSPGGAVAWSDDSALPADLPVDTASVPVVDTASVPVVDTASVPVVDTASVAAAGVSQAKRRRTLRSPVAESPEDAHERNLWTVLVFVLAAITAAAFLPAWDRGTATSSITGQSVVRSLGNAFSGPWQQVVGTVVAAVAVLIVPVVAIRLRDKGVGAALAAGAILVLSTQLVAAVVQVNLPVPPADFGLSQAQASQLGLVLSVKLTGWFVVDAIAAYLLFAAVIVRATLRDVPQEALANHAAPGQSPWPPDASPVNPWSPTPPPSPWARH
ncbi:MAG: hypothetical protein ACP5P1_11715 [Acidimicrobiales bacterium]